MLCRSFKKKGANEVSDDPEHEDHDWNVTKNKCHETEFFFCYL